MSKIKLASLWTVYLNHLVCPCLNFYLFFQIRREMKHFLVNSESIVGDKYLRENFTFWFMILLRIKLFQKKL